MKFNICILFILTLLFNACSFFQDDPYLRLEKSIFQKNKASQNSINVNLFTLPRKKSSGEENKELMKASIDFQTDKDRIGIFWIGRDSETGLNITKEMAVINLLWTEKKNFKSGIVLQLNYHEPRSKAAKDSLDFYFVVFDKNNEKVSGQVTKSIRLRNPHSNPFGIQEYQRSNIEDDKMIHLARLRNSYNRFNPKTGKTDRGYNSRFVLKFYNSNNHDELSSYMNDHETQQIIRSHEEEYLEIPSNFADRGYVYNYPNDFQGFAFGEDGK